MPSSLPALTHWVETVARLTQPEPIHWCDGPDDGLPRRPRACSTTAICKGAGGTFLWSGFGDNLRVLEWMIQRIAGDADALETPIGLLPHAHESNCDGLDCDRGQLDQLLAVDAGAWKAEIDAVRDYLQSYGERPPAALAAELDWVEAALAG